MWGADQASKRNDDDSDSSDGIVVSAGDAFIVEANRYVLGGLVQGDD